MNTATLLFTLAGGALLGLSALLLVLAQRRAPRMLGFLRGWMAPSAQDHDWRLWFVAGVLMAGGAVVACWPEVFGAGIDRSRLTLAAAGLLVGFGVALGTHGRAR